MPELHFNKTVENEHEKKIYFVSYLREGFVERSLVIYIDKKNKLKTIYFSSYEFGSVEWINGNGLQEYRVWEDDEQAEASTYLTRRYTARLADGMADEQYAQERIIPDVLENLADKDFSQFIRKIISKKRYRSKIDFNTFTPQE
jgi:hypothetical protein